MPRPEQSVAREVDLVAGVALLPRTTECPGSRIHQSLVHGAGVAVHGDKKNTALVLTIICTHFVRRNRIPQTTHTTSFLNDGGETGARLPTGTDDVGWRHCSSDDQSGGASHCGGGAGAGGGSQGMRGGRGRGGGGRLRRQESLTAQLGHALFKAAQVVQSGQDTCVLGFATPFAVLTRPMLECAAAHV